MFIDPQISPVSFLSDTVWLSSAGICLIASTSLRGFSLKSSKNLAIAASAASSPSPSTSH